MENYVYPRGCDSAKVIQVIETKSARGAGTDEQPSRIVTQYWTLDGKRLATEPLVDMLDSCHPAIETSYLGTYRTEELVEELAQRPGVEKQVAGPYQDLAVTLNGPAVALIVTD